jgi:DNA-binding transcriptional regulator YiaG
MAGSTMAAVGRRLASSVDHVARERNEPNLHPCCTQAAPPGATAVDHDHGEAYAVTVVGQWTGQEASALRHALRLTIRDFADHLGVAERTVAKWEAGGSAMVPVPVMQATLDTVLARAPDEAKGRFAMLLAATRGPAGLPGSAMTLGAAALAGPAPVPRRLDPEAIRRLRTILLEYARIDNLLGPAHLLDLVTLHLNFIGELLTLASGQVRAELLTVGAWYAEFAGWLYLAVPGRRRPATSRLLDRSRLELGAGRRRSPEGLLRADAQEQPGIQRR